MLTPSPFGLVAQQDNKVYYVGGYSSLRSATNPSAGRISLANSHIYAVDFSSSVDIQKNYLPLFTSITRLPDLVPRISQGNFLWRESSLNLFGGAQTTNPIFLPNGSFSLSDRVTIGDTLFQKDTSDAGTWTRGPSFAYNSTQKIPIGRAATAFDARSDDGQGVLWFYGGGYWEEPVKIGTEAKGPTVNMVEFEDLWRIPGECHTESIAACKQTTTTPGNSSIPRGSLQGTMAWVDNGLEGWLVLVGGTFRGELVRT